MNSADVRAALRSRWPDTDYLVVDEAPDGPSRQGRKLDMVAISLWASRGYTVDGVEIKVSAGDLRRELKEPAKADWWWKHCDRFWVAVPTELVKVAKNECPDTWGILACSDGKSRVARAAPKRAARQPFTWPEVVGLLRASADAGFGALNRATQSGYDRGLATGRMEASRSDPDTRLAAEVGRLSELLRTVAEHAGVKRVNDAWTAREVGADAAAGRVLRISATPLAERSERTLDGLVRAANEMRALVELLRSGGAPTDGQPSQGTGPERRRPV